MQAFIGRKSELRFLNDLYALSRFELIGIFGRSRIGKMRPINEYVKDVPCGFCTAVEGDPMFATFGDGLEVRMKSWTDQVW